MEGLMILVFGRKLWERETILQGKQFESVKLSDDEKLSNGY